MLPMARVISWVGPLDKMDWQQNRVSWGIAVLRL